jgi:thymidylate synthase
VAIVPQLEEAMIQRLGNHWVADSHEFDLLCENLSSGLRLSQLYDRGRWQSQDVSARPEMNTRELWNVSIAYDMPKTLEALQRDVEPNLPWADDHFAERVSGKPLNPPPSSSWWPFNKADNAEHKSKDKFSHTYPERFWPKRAIDPQHPMYGHTNHHVMQKWGVNRGIRFDYGDLADVVNQLRDDPFTRQAYLPVWFPEDTGAVHGERVPCSLGYHFVRNGPRLDCNYFMRSCDFFRHFRDDVYLAARLTGWIGEQLQFDLDHFRTPWLGTLNMFISNLHCFRGDQWLLDRLETTS